MHAATLAQQRLHNHQLSQPQVQPPEEVVAWLGAVQAQEYAHARWGLGLRLPGATDAAIEQALTDGRILRTHVMRPTWHFVTPADIRWLLALTAPRVHKVNAHMYRKCELDKALFARSNAAIVKALESGQHLTRAELGVALGQVGMQAEGTRLSLIVMAAELEGLVCSGARRGKQFTYALLDDHAPKTRHLTREEGLAELTRRYFSSHGPATIQDFSWWSGLTQADVKVGLELAKSHLVHETIGG
ncbi:MAG: winged helix DNA-binding domain-containing protein, partial [Chloroflexaceae bacterium]|nr:winged helix DNA-binding domain-containing protein [Chloroflexaceae bacterium]